MRLIRSAARSAARTTALAALAALVAACGGSNSAKPGSAASTPTASAPASPAASAPASPSAPAADAVTYQVTIKGGNVEPKPDVVKVKLGQTVRLTVTSDQHDEIHVHGYDVSAELEPNKPTTVEFKASTPGTFEVETHHSGKLLFRLQVQ